MDKGDAHLTGFCRPVQLGAGVDYYKIVHNAYTSQYLQNLGIEPLEQHRKALPQNCKTSKMRDVVQVVARKCALTDCQIEVG